MIDAKEELRLRELEAGRYRHYLFLTEKSYRLDALLNLAEAGEFKGDPATYWSLVRTFSVDSDIDEADPVWSELLAIDIPKRQHMTSEKDRGVLAALPAQVQIWRGFGADCGDISPDDALGGHSWSLSKDVASRFARRFARPSGRPGLARATISKDNIIALLLERGEEEVVCLPEDIDEIEIMDIDQEAEDHFASIREL